MSQTKLLSPDEIKAYNDVFVASLAQLNDLAHQQRMQILQEAITVRREINGNVPSDPSQISTLLADTKSDPAKKNLNTETAVHAVGTENPVSEESDPFYANLIKAISDAQQNAVSTQNQGCILAQAALTQGIMMMYSNEDVGEIARLLDKSE